MSGPRVTTTSARAEEAKRVLTSVSTGTAKLVAVTRLLPAHASASIKQRGCTLALESGAPKAVKLNFDG